MGRTLRRFAGSALVVAMIAAAGGRDARADLVLNEVLYDPEGPDEGREFVELWNPDAVPRTLEGVVVEAGDGARPDVWSPLYAGSVRDTLHPASAFLIAGAALGGAIQNGPDAVRLARDGVAIDLLGWGALETEALSEGAPAEDAPSGQSLARRADGVDTGSNGLDWEPAPAPTPGRANHPDVRLALLPGRTRLDPPVPWPGEVTTARATVQNLGRLAVAGEAWGIEVDLLPPASDSTAAVPGASGTAPPARATIARYAGVTIAPGESLGIAPTFDAPSAGLFQLRLRLVGLSSPAVADTAAISLRSGAGPAVVNEISFRDAGAGEWVEIAALESIPDARLLWIGDATGALRSVAGGDPVPLEPGALLVLAEDPARVRAAFGLPAERVLGTVGGWPALNDADGPAGEADQAWLVGPRAVPWDAVPYRATYAAGGRSLERIATDLPSGAAGSWGSSLDRSGGTPGRPNTLRAPSAGEGQDGALLVAAERVLARSGSVLIRPIVLRLTPAARNRELRVLVQDLLGRKRRVLIDGARFAGEGAFLWDGQDDAGEPVPPGIYIVRAETAGGAGTPPSSSSLPITVVDRRGP